MARRAKARRLMEPMGCGRQLPYRDRWGRFAHRPPPPTPPPDPVLFPSVRHPRWRLRVFDQVWPWRASQSEAVDDARDSGNATFDAQLYRRTFMIAPATIERDPA